MDTLVRASSSSPSPSTGSHSYPRRLSVSSSAPPPPLPAKPDAFAPPLPLATAYQPPAPASKPASSSFQHHHQTSFSRPRPPQASMGGPTPTAFARRPSLHSASSANSMSEDGEPSVAAPRHSYATSGAGNGGGGGGGGSGAATLLSARSSSGLYELGPNVPLSGGGGATSLSASPPISRSSTSSSSAAARRRESLVTAAMASAAYGEEEHTIASSSITSYGQHQQAATAFGGPVVGVTVGPSPSPSSLSEEEQERVDSPQPLSRTTSTASSRRRVSISNGVILTGSSSSLTSLSNSYTLPQQGVLPQRPIRVRQLSGDRRATSTSLYELGSGPTEDDEQQPSDHLHSDPLLTHGASARRSSSTSSSRHRRMVSAAELVGAAGAVAVGLGIDAVPKGYPTDARQQWARASYQTIESSDANSAYDGIGSPMSADQSHDDLHHREQNHHTYTNDANDDDDDDDGQRSEDGSDASGYSWDDTAEHSSSNMSLAGAAIHLVEDGTGKIIHGEDLDLERPENLGMDLIGATHLLLAASPTPSALPRFLETVLPSLTSSLVVLDLSASRLTSLPLELGALYCLEELNLSSNPLRSLPAFLSQLYALRVLQANEIGCTTLPTSLAALTNLHTLCLRRNRLIQLPGWLSQLPNLETLLVEGNVFEGPWKGLTENIVRFSPSGTASSSEEEVTDQQQPQATVASTTTATKSLVGSTTPNTDTFYLGSIANSFNSHANTGGERESPFDPMNAPRQKQQPPLTSSFVAEAARARAISHSYGAAGAGDDSSSYAVRSASGPAALARALSAISTGAGGECANSSASSIVSPISPSGSMPGSPAPHNTHVRPSSSVAAAVARPPAMRKRSNTLYQQGSPAHVLNGGLARALSPGAGVNGFSRPPPPEPSPSLSSGGGVRGAVRRMRSAGTINSSVGRPESSGTAQPPLPGAELSIPASFASVGLGRPPVRPISGNTGGGGKRFASLGRASGQVVDNSAYRDSKAGTGVPEGWSDVSSAEDGGYQQHQPRRPSTPTDDGGGGTIGRSKDKGKKWGAILKKMSMGRMRSGSVGQGHSSGSKSVPASANNSAHGSPRPTGPIHSYTMPMSDGSTRYVEGNLPPRPSTAMGMGLGANYDGGSSPRQIPGARGNTPNPYLSPEPHHHVLLSGDGPLSVASYGSTASARSKAHNRRSFLPLDTHIPTTSPFLGYSLTSFGRTSLSLAGSGSAGSASGSIASPSVKEEDSVSVLESYLDDDEDDRPSSSDHHHHQPTTLPGPLLSTPSTAEQQQQQQQPKLTEDERRTRYLAGLSSLMGYLRDLHDLSLNPIVHQQLGGDEPGVAAAAATNTSTGAMAAVAVTPNPSALSSSSPSPTPPYGYVVPIPTPPMSTSSRNPSIRGRRPTISSPSGGGEIGSRTFSDGSSVWSGLAGSGGAGGAGAERATSGIETSASDESREAFLEVKQYKDNKIRRCNQIREIVETERTYVRSLIEVVDLYVKPAGQSVPSSGLTSSSARETVVPLAERKVVFGGLDSLLTFHRDSLLPRLEEAAAPIFAIERKGQTADHDGAISREIALQIGDVFRTYNPFMRMYSTFINNFDNSLQRLQSWMLPPTSSAMTSPNASSSHIATMGIGAMSIASPSLTADPAVGGAGAAALSTAQRKRIKHFLKRARADPRHSQIDLQSYLLLPIQRIPRYKMMLDGLDLATPPDQSSPYDPLGNAAEEISVLASCMNEEKRDSESRRRLVQWQARIRGKFPSPLVQPHRKLLHDGNLVLTRIVRRETEYHEVSLPIIEDGDNTITGGGKTLVAIDRLGPSEPTRTPLVAILTSDLLVLCKTDGSPDARERGTVDLFAVLRMQTKTQPASFVAGTILRVVDNRAILYFEAPSQHDVHAWQDALNVRFQVSR